MPHDVFISYSSKRRKIADAVRKSLLSDDITCWMAPWDIPSGREYTKEIIDGIEGSRLFLLIFSSECNTSRWVRSEVGSGFSSGLNMLTYRIENVKPCRALALYLNSRQWLDDFEPTPEHNFTKLKIDIKKLLDSKEPSHELDPSSLVKTRQLPNFELQLDVAPPFPRNTPDSRPKASWCKKLFLPGLACMLLVVLLLVAVRYKSHFTASEPSIALKQPTATAVALWSDLESLAVNAAHNISLSTDKERYKIGEAMRITCKVETRGYLNVLHLSESDSSVSMLFPNRFHKDNLVEPGDTIIIPAENDAFQLKAQPPPGRSLVVVVLTQKPIDALQLSNLAQPSDLFGSLSENRARAFAVEAKSMDGGKYDAGRIVVEVE